MFAGLHAFDHDLRLRVSGSSGAGVSETFHMAIGEDVQDLKVSVVSPGVVEGVVVDGKGQPVPGARVWLRNWDLQRGRQKDGGVEEVIADRNGRYRHVGVEPGGHYLDGYVACLGIPAAETRVGSHFFSLFLRGFTTRTRRRTSSGHVSGSLPQPLRAAGQYGGRSAQDSRILRNVRPVCGITTV